MIREEMVPEETVPEKTLSIKALREEVTQEATEEITNWLGSDDLEMLLTVQDCIERRGPEAAAALQVLAHRDAYKYRAGKQRLQRLLTLAVTFAIYALTRYANNPRSASELALALLIPAWLILPFLLSWYDAHRTCQRRLNHTTVLLQRMKHVPAISVLIEAMEIGDSRTSSIAARSLKELLPQLHAQDRALLKVEHHTYLHHALRGSDSYLILAILQAFEQVGNESDLLHVQRLTDCPPWIAQSQRIRATARKCLSILEARAESEHPAQTFLRMWAAAHPNSLLRPAAGAPETDARQLLRAGTAAEPEQQQSSIS